MFGGGGVEGFMGTSKKNSAIGFSCGVVNVPHGGAKGLSTHHGNLRGSLKLRLGSFTLYNVIEM